MAKKRLINRKKDIINPLLIIVLSFVVLLSIGYSAYIARLSVSDITAYVRINKDVRITNLSVSNGLNGGISNSEEFETDKVYLDVLLPQATSSVTYEVEVKNFGNIEAGIKSIEIPNELKDKIDIEVTNYTVGNILTDNSETCISSVSGCKLDIKRTFNITVKYKNGVTTNKHYPNIALTFDFEVAHKITYTDITNNNYPSYILDGNTLDLTFTDPIPKKLVLYSNGVKLNSNSYTYQNNRLSVQNITDDIEIKYMDKVYIVTQGETNYFKDTYKTDIKTVTFVDYIDTTDAIKVYDITDTNLSPAGSIMAWIVTNYNLYNINDM